MTRDLSTYEVNFSNVRDFKTRLQDLYKLVKKNKVQLNWQLKFDDEGMAFLVDTIDSEVTNNEWNSENVKIISNIEKEEC